MRDRRTLLVATTIGAALATVPAAAQTCNDGLPELGQALCVADPVNVLPTSDHVHTVLASDVNADGHPDVVAVTASLSYVRLGTGNGFGFGTRQWHSGAVLTDIAVGDFNGDLRPDLAVADRANDRVLVRYNTGAAASFTAGTPFAAGGGPVRVLAARLNGDLLADLVVLNDDADTVSVLIAHPGGFHPAVDYGVGDAPDIALGDCDANGTRDLYYLTGQGAGARMNIRRNLGTGILQPPILTAYPLVDAEYGVLEPRAIVAGDLDGNGTDDVVVSATWSRLVPGTSNGNGTVTQQAFGWTWAWTEKRIRTVDWDQNGTLDVAAPHVWGPHLSIAWGDGAGSFGVPAIMYGVEHLDGQVTVPVRDVAFADFTGDGETDIVLATGSGVVLQVGEP